MLFRTNAQSRPLEEALARARLPFRMVGAQRFFARKEVQVAEDSPSFPGSVTPEAGPRVSLLLPRRA